MFSSGASFNDQSVLKHNESNIVFRRNKDGSVLITQLNNDNKFYKINGVAAELWMKLDGSQSLQKIMQELLSSYDVDSNLLYKDSESALTELMKLDFLIKVS
jgi:hypothetical protein